MGRSSGADGFRIALVGCGYWGSKHARVLQSMEYVAEVVLVDSREDRLRNLARNYKTARCYPVLDAALEHVDAVVVSTPPSAHVPVAMAAIKAGKHVLVEKPLAPTSAGARALVSAAAAQGVVLMVGHTFEYNPAVRKLRDLVQSQELGELYYIDSARLNLGLYQNDVNVIFDLAPHDVSIINYVLGRTPVAAAAWACRHAHQQFEDVAYLRLFYDDSFVDRGMSANIHVSWLDPCKVRRVTAVGSRKMAVYDDLAADEQIRVLDKGVSPPPLGDDLTQPPMSYRYGDIVVPFVSPEEPLSVQDRHFIDCIETGARPLTDGENGLAVVEALEAAEVSRRLGRPVLLDEVRSDNRLARLSGRYNGHNGSGHRAAQPLHPVAAAEPSPSLLAGETP
ncbi:MAG: Gfo/Idh/MocA family oxidoreductase [Streptosporangiaceae bacterium]|nr:Gfo/Idh/MocA family oxidoreductase [Streptosporangiaceae bacterium]